MKDSILYHPKNYFVIEPFKYSHMNIQLKKLYNDMYNFSNIFKEEEETNNDNKSKNKSRNFFKSNTSRRNIKDIKSKIPTSLIKRNSINNKNLINTFRSSKNSKNKSSNILDNYNLKDQKDKAQKSQLKIPLLSIRNYFDKKSLTNKFSKTQRIKNSKYLNIKNKIRASRSSSFFINNKINSYDIYKLIYCNLDKNNNYNFLNDSSLSSKNKKNIRLIKENNNNNYNCFNNSSLSSRNTKNISMIRENNYNNYKKDLTNNFNKSFLNENKDLKDSNISFDNKINNENYNENLINLNNINNLYNKIKNNIINGRNSKNNIIKIPTLKRKVNTRIIREIKEIEKNSEDKQKLMKKDKNTKIKKNKSMKLLKVPKGNFFEDLELESKKEATSYQKKIGQFYRRLDVGLYTGHFFTILRKDHFFGNDYLLHKIPKYYY